MTVESGVKGVTICLLLVIAGITGMSEAAPDLSNSGGGSWQYYRAARQATKCEQNSQKLQRNTNILSRNKTQIKE